MPFGLSFAASLFRRRQDVAPPGESDGSGRMFRAHYFLARHYNARHFG